jgi:predicted PurR-regulated permease PerM
MPRDLSKRKREWVVAAIPAVVFICVLGAGGPLWGAVGFAFLALIVTMFSVAVMDVR